MARYEPKKHPVDPLNDSFEGGDESEDATEEDIESNFVSYRPSNQEISQNLYIGSC